MNIIGFRAGTIDVTKVTKKDYAMTSEANQWKIHKSGIVVATGANQIFTIAHGLSYTPAYIAFYRQPTFNTYYEWLTNGGSNYIDAANLVIQLVNTGDIGSYIIFKDFGA